MVEYRFLGDARRVGAQRQRPLGGRLEDQPAELLLAPLDPA